MINPKLQPFFNALRYFLSDVADIPDCIRAFTKTQEYLAELIEIRSTHDFERKKLSLKYEKEVAKLRESAYAKLVKRAHRPTESAIEDIVSANLPQELTDLKESIDSHQINSETATSLIMAMMQRKEIIGETISYFKFKKDADSCVMKNKQFLHKLGIMVDERDANELSKSPDREGEELLSY